MYSTKYFTFNSAGMCTVEVPYNDPVWDEMKSETHESYYGAFVAVDTFRIFLHSYVTNADLVKSVEGYMNHYDSLSHIGGYLRMYGWKRNFRTLSMKTLQSRLNIDEGIHGLFILKIRPPVLEELSL